VREAASRPAQRADPAKTEMRPAKRPSEFCAGAGAGRIPIIGRMEFIRDIHARKAAAGQPVVSFEFFPPKTEEGDRTLLEKTLPALKAAQPDYCSVTYGAGGGTREKTLMIVDRIQREHGLTTMCHLTCVNATVEELRGVLL